MPQSVLKNDNGDAKRKRDAKKTRSDFDTRHESNTKNVYVVWDMTNDIIKPTKFWKNMLKADQMVFQPFKPDELMGEGDSVHNLCRMADKKKQLSTGEFHDVNLWISMFHGAFDRKAATYNNPEAPRLRKLAGRLCKTNPKSLFDGYTWKGLTLISRADTIAWTAARKFFGDVWKVEKNEFDIAKESKTTMDVDEEEQPKKDKDKEKEKPTILKKTTWKDITKEGKDDNDNMEIDPNIVTPKKAATIDAPPKETNVNAFFLSKGIRPKQNTNRLENVAYARKHTAYIKTKLPKVTNKDDDEAEDEVVKAFSAMIQRLMTIDKRTIIYSWNDRKTVKPLVDGKPLPKTRAQMEIYVDRVYIQYGRAAYCRMKVGFDGEEDLFFGDNDWFSGKGYWYEKDELQVKITSNAGWFVGSIAIKESNVKDLAEAIRQHPLLKAKNLQVSIRSHAIKIDQQEKIKPDDMIKALHVYGDYTRMGTLREVIRRIYKEGQNKGYPLGIKMRYVPNIADPRYPVTAGTKSNIKILRGKQKSFLKNIRKQKSHTIQGLDFYLETTKTTLRQVIMGMRSGEDPEKAIFLTIEDDGGTRATFTFHKKVEEEARHMVTVLPIMLQHLYGPRIWTWFTDEAKQETSGWFYDEALNRVVSPDENYTKDMLEEFDWDDDSIEETEDIETSRPTTFKMSKIVLDAPAKGNYYNDNGTIKTTAPLFKEMASINTTTETLPAAVSTDDDTTKAASALTDESSMKDKMAMAKVFLDAMKNDDDLKKLFKQALEPSASPISGAGVDD
jgi:hypothetical protein